MLPKEFINEIERLFTENFEDYTITKGEDYFIITKDDSVFDVVRTECSYKIYLETSGRHLCHKVSICGFGNLIDTFKDCIYEDYFEDTITCFMNVLMYKQNRLRRKFKQIGKKYNMGGDKNVK